MNLIKKYKLDKSSWTYKGFHGVLHTFFPVGQVGLAMKKIFGAANTVTLFFVQNNYVHWYWHDHDLTRIRNIFFRRLKADPSYLPELQKKWHRSQQKFDAIIKKTHQTNISKLTNHELASLYKEFYNHYIEEFAYFMTLGDAVSMHADRYLVPEFKRKLGDDFDKVFPQLITTKHASFIEREQRERRQLIGQYQRRGRVNQAALAAHAAKYFYINNNYAKGIYLSKAEFMKMIWQDARKLSEIKLKPQNKASKSKLIKRYKFTPWQKTLLQVMDEFFGIQDERKKYVLISNYYQFRFLREAEKRGGLPFKLLLYTIIHEYEDALAGKISRALLKQRQQLCLCLFNKQGHKVFTGSQARSTLKFFNQLMERGTDITGIIAAKGKAEGIVKIILKVHDMINMEDGDVLVSSMTRPEMLPAMKKASAIVTDEGGLTCHAAIIARELGIPCVIGTKVATRVLQDGDRVEVDADKGVVKKLAK